MSVRGRQSFAAIAFVALGVWLTVATYAVAERMAISALRDSTARCLDLYAANLQTERLRFDYLPDIIASDPRVRALLAQPQDPELRQQVDEYLETIDKSAGASAIFVMDLQGLTVAASNWRQPGSFVNTNFSYRPYFQEAVSGRSGRFYGIGTVSREAGYYFSAGVGSPDAMTGAVAVKVNLEHLDQAWAHQGLGILVTDGNGIVFLSSESHWKFKTLSDLPFATMGRLAATRQYSEAGLLGPLGFSEKRKLEEGGSEVDIGTLPTTTAMHGDSFLLLGRELASTDWRMSVLADMAPVYSTARTWAGVTALAVVVLGLMLSYARQRRLSVAESQIARTALQRAYEELEEKVRTRTTALSDANQRLHEEIGERRRAEESLRATLQDLVQTAKMAVLGRMSASITHELNQPLAAVQTLSDNTLVLLERGRHDEAKTNLRMIAKTTAHMGKITAQLKKFARRSDVGSEPVQVAAVVLDALFLLRQGQRAQNVRLLSTHIREGAVALCECNRLEQVIVNLLANAMDAVENVPDPTIEVIVEQAGDCVWIEVHDNGPGVTENVLRRLFEPFFTTKRQGMGLGLGLAISNDIVRHFGGVLTAGRSGHWGGASFTVKLKSVSTPIPAHA